MRICFVCDSYPSRPPAGGIANYVRNTASEMVSIGNKVWVVSVIRNQTETLEFTEDNGVQVRFVSKRRLPGRSIFKGLSLIPSLRFFSEVVSAWELLERALGAWLEVFKLDNDYDFDVVECSDFGGLPFWGLLFPRLRSKTIVRGHSYVDPDLAFFNWPGSKFHHFLEKYSLRRAKRVLAVSSYLEERYRNHFRVNAERIGTLYSGFKEHRLSKVQFSQPIENIYRIAFIGTLDLIKGSDVLFKAIPMIIQSYPNVKFTIVGVPTDNFRQQIDDSDVRRNPNVNFVGSLTHADTQELLGQIDLLVLPSRFETFGRVLVEAHLHKKPVVATSIGGIPEIVIHGENGLLVDPGDPDALAQAITNMVANPELGAEMGIKGYQRAIEKFSFSAIVPIQQELYSKFVSDN